MPDITNEQEKFEQLMEVYKQKIGNIDNKRVVNNHTDQELDQLIRNENEQISRAIRLKGFSGEEQDIDFIQRKYHESEIDNNRRINKLIIAITIMGMLFLAVAIAGRIVGFLTDASIPVISGVVSEVVGVLIKALQTASDKSKLKYFKTLDEQRNRNVTVELIKSMKDGAPKNRMIEKVVEAIYSSAGTEKD